LKIIAATDGSNFKNEKFGWAWVATFPPNQFQPNSIGYGCELIDNFWVHAWNVAAECTAVIELLRSFGPENEFEIFHDYEGLGRWARGEWSANKPCSSGYCKELKRLNRNVTFAQVKGHSGHAMNELADKLAKRALREQPRITVVKPITADLKFIDWDK